MTTTLKYNLRQISDIACSGFQFEMSEDTYNMINYLSTQVGAIGLTSPTFVRQKRDPVESSAKDIDNDFSSANIKNKKKKDGKVNDYFRNSITVIMMMDGKKINFKISSNGKFQMTGCKYDNQAENCVKYIWEYIKPNKDIYSLTETETETFKALFIPAMRNIDFSLGFILNREKLDEYFNTYTNYYSLLETSIGYTGVNIKIPVKKPIKDLMIKELTYNDNKWISPLFIPYQKYLDTLKPREQQKKIEKERFNTFLVFHSGKVICSSMCEEFAKDTYYEFLEIIRQNYHEFQEKLIK